MLRHSVGSGELQWATVVSTTSDGGLRVLGLLGQGCNDRRLLRTIGLRRRLYRLVVCHHDDTHPQAVQSAARRDLRVQPARRPWLEVIRRTGDSLSTSKRFRRYVIIWLKFRLNIGFSSCACGCFISFLLCFFYKRMYITLAVVCHIVSFTCPWVLEIYYLIDCVRYQNQLIDYRQAN